VALLGPELVAARHAAAREPKKQLVERQLALLAVGLDEAVAVHHERCAFRQRLDLVGVVSIGGAVVAVLDEVLAGAGVGGATHKLRAARRTIEQIARGRRDAQDHLAAAEWCAHLRYLEPRQDLVERRFSRVEAQPRHHSLEGGKHHQAVTSEQNAARIRRHARRHESRLTEGDVLEHARR
jgi:hypothetical protein